MKIERDFLVQTLKKSGMHGKIHESIKSMKNCNEVHTGAVLRIGEKFTRSGSKKRYTDNQGQRKQRNKLFSRITTLHVVIADTSEEKVENILSEFLKRISKGLEVNGNWADIEISDADWVEGDDSILKSKIAVEFDVIMTGGIYIDRDIVTASVGSVKADMEQNGGD